MNSKRAKLIARCYCIMHEPTFRQALSHSWALVKHKKSLWIFGLLSAAIGQWGLSDFLGAYYRIAQSNFIFFNWSEFVYYLSVWNWSKVSVILLVLWLLGIILLIALSVIFVAAVARGALISYAIYYYKTGKILSLNEAWHKGAKKVFPVLGITITGRLLQLLDLWLFSEVAQVILRYTTFGYSLLFVLVSIMAIFLALVVEAISIYASGYLLLDGQSLKKSLQKGMDLLVNHLMVSLELGLVLVAFNALFLGAVVYGSFAVFVPSVIMWLLAGLTGFNSLIAFGMYTGNILYAIFVLVLAGIFNAFVTCSWVYLFMKMHHEGVLSRIGIYFKKFFKL